MINVTIPEKHGETRAFYVERWSSCGHLIERIGPFDTLYIMWDVRLKKLRPLEKIQLACELAIRGKDYGVF